MVFLISHQVSPVLLFRLNTKTGVITPSLFLQKALQWHSMKESKVKTCSVTVLVMVAPLQVTPKSQPFFHTCGFGVSGNQREHNMGNLCTTINAIGSLSGVSTGKTQGLGMTWQLGSGIIWKHYHLYVRRLHTVSWDLSWGSWPEHQYVSCLCDLMAWAPTWSPRASRT
jgi:hypothetical protein